MLLLLLCPTGFVGTLAGVLALARAFKLLLLVVDLLDCVDVNVDKTGEGVSDVSELTVTMLLLEIPPPFGLSCLGYIFK
jgi:hypothetical protein